MQEEAGAGYFVDIVLNTNSGEIIGRQNVSIYGDEYVSFERIPFAKPPLGELRFRAPEPVEPWPQILDCTRKAEKPKQKVEFKHEIDGSEDCLYLNVYTKQLQSAAPLPIMVFLCGGGFAKADPTRDFHSPDYFMMKQVVLVTIAYRVGALGFLSLKDPKLNVPGNAGLKDQLLGLQWIKQNANFFNGDPNNITLFGSSAGATSVHYLMSAPQAKGLFHKAILMSGTMLCPFALSTLKNLPYRLAQANGYKRANEDSDVLDYLQQLDADDLLRPYLPTMEESLHYDCIYAFGPVVEPYQTENCIIAKEPSELLATAWGNGITVMFGGTSFEGLLMYTRARCCPFLITGLEQNYENLLPLNLKQKYDLKKRLELAKTVQNMHFEQSKIDMDSLLKYCDYASYKIFWHPIHRSIKARLQHASAAHTYLYRFDFDSPTFNYHRIKYCGKDVTGVSHGDDHSYLFYGKFSWILERESREYKIIERMIDIWTTFAANSNPNCKQTEGLNWLPLSDKNKLKCLNINEELKVIDLPEMEKLKTWQCLYE